MGETILDGAGGGYKASVTSGGRLRVETGDSDPTDGNNPAWKFEYDAQNNLGSVTQFIDTGSFVNVLTWEGFSGTSIGVGSRVTNVGSYS